MCHFQGCVLDKLKRPGFVLEEDNLGGPCASMSSSPLRDKESVLCCPWSSSGQDQPGGGNKHPRCPVQAGLGSQQG